MAVKVKICGLTNVADAQVAVDAGADFLGFILFPKSPRYIQPAQVGEILDALTLPAHVRTVGVFVNVPVEEVAKILEETGLSLAQLHGDETEDALATLQGRGYKVVRPVDAAAAQQATRFTTYPGSDAPQLMLDTYDPAAYGGTGKQSDWPLAATVSQTTPRLMLAGGLNADNVQRAIRTVKPWAVDVASGVEASPGRKNHDQVRHFIANAASVS